MTIKENREFLEWANRNLEAFTNSLVSINQALTHQVISLLEANARYGASTHTDEGTHPSFDTQLSDAQKEAEGS